MYIFIVVHFKRNDYELSTTNVCLNGGFMQKGYDKLTSCVCPPGFKGQFCETGNSIFSSLKKCII